MVLDETTREKARNLPAKSSSSCVAKAIGFKDLHPFRRSQTSLYLISPTMWLLGCSLNRHSFLENAWLAAFWKQSSKRSSERMTISRSDVDNHRFARNSVDSSLLAAWRPLKIKRTYATSAIFVTCSLTSMSPYFHSRYLHNVVVSLPLNHPLSMRKGADNQDQNRLSVNRPTKQTYIGVTSGLAKKPCRIWPWMFKSNNVLRQLHHMQLQGMALGKITSLWKNDVQIRGNWQVVNLEVKQHYLKLNCDEGKQNPSKISMKPSTNS